MPDLSEMSQDSSVFPAIPSHLLESTPRIRQRSRRRGRRGKQTQQPSPLGKTPTHTGTSSNSASASSSEQSPSPTLVSSRRPSDPLILLNRRGEDAPANRTRELPPHLPATGELALGIVIVLALCTHMQLTQWPRCPLRVQPRRSRSCATTCACSRRSRRRLTQGWTNCTLRSR